jgi:hypothetical protein
MTPTIEEGRHVRLALPMAAEHGETGVITCVVREGDGRPVCAFVEIDGGGGTVCVPVYALLAISDRSTR